MTTVYKTRCRGQWRDMWRGTFTSSTKLGSHYQMLSLVISTKLLFPVGIGDLILLQRIQLSYSKPTGNWDRISQMAWIRFENLKKDAHIYIYSILRRRRTISSLECKGIVANDIKNMRRRGQWRDIYYYNFP